MDQQTRLKNEYHNSAENLRLEQSNPINWGLHCLEVYHRNLLGKIYDFLF